jgi:sarcosine oxidase / L-pipecolate oxidase
LANPSQKIKAPIPIPQPALKEPGFSIPIVPSSQLPHVSFAANMGSSPPPRSSILILGSGIFGTSTAYHLSQSHPSPSSITVLDRAPFPSPTAASTDINKIVRADYSSLFYMNLAFEAMDAWASWPIFKDSDVYHRSGWIMLDEKSSDLAERIRKNFRESGRDDGSTLRDVGFDEVREGWGGVFKDADLEGFARAYVNGSAGWADASRAVEVMMQAAVERGVRYAVGEAERLVLEDNKVKGVRTIDGTVYKADKVLLCTGAWTSLFLSATEDELGMGEERVERQVSAAGVCLAHYKLTEEEYKYYEKMPVLIYGRSGKFIHANFELTPPVHFGTSNTHPQEKSSHQPKTTSSNSPTPSPSLTPSQHLPATLSLPLQLPPKPTYPPS